MISGCPDTYIARPVKCVKLYAVFCPVPKVACSNWKALMRKLAGVRDYTNTTFMHDKARNGLRYLASYPATEQRRIIKEYYKFVFVRSPWTRVVSAYINKVRRRRRSRGVPAAVAHPADTRCHSCLFSLRNKSS